MFSEKTAEVFGVGGVSRK